MSNLRPYQENLLRGSLDAVNDLQRAVVSMRAISAPQEVLLALAEVGPLLDAVVGATEKQAVINLTEEILVVLSRVEKHYMDLKSDSSCGPSDAYLEAP